MNLRNAKIAFVALACLGSWPLPALGQDACQFEGEPAEAGSVRLDPFVSGLDRPVKIALAPGERNRLYVVEQSGKVRVIENGRLLTGVFLDIQDRSTPVGGGGDERGFLGLAFHPAYAQNKKLYVNYTTRSPLKTRVSEFTAGANGAVDRNTERVILEIPQPYSNHNGGEIEFGPDGYLYIGTGDGGSGGDPQNLSQNLTSLLGKMLRIDVNRTSAALAYAIPASNPTWSQVPEARKEIWAYGLRNPWRFSFDRVAGDLWAGDVGQGALEEINVVRAGKNYGWNIMEGTRCFNAPTCNRNNLEFPIFEYGRQLGISVTGGVMYRGTKYPDLVGTYLFADYGSGRIWGLRWDGERATSVKVMAETGRNIVAFGEDADGEVYVAALAGGVFKLTVPVATAASRFPRTVRETGCFSDMRTFAPAPGVVPYSVALPLWTDGALKQRWIKVPPGQSLDFRADAPFAFPEGTILIKNFAIPTRVADTTETIARTIETRFLVKKSGVFRGYSYRWNDEGTDAFLLSGAATRQVTIAESPNEPDRDETFSYYYPSMGDCTRCHTQGAGEILGFSAKQLNTRDSVGGVSTEQLRRLAQAGIFRTASLPASLETIGTLPAINNTAASLQTRAKAYLAVQCAGCHNPSSTAGQTPLDFRFETPLAAMNVCSKIPQHGDLGVEGATLLEPGQPQSSLLWLRMRSINTAVRMPPIGMTRRDEPGVNLVARWIESLAGPEDCR